jgi:hypothetical protein
LRPPERTVGPVVEDFDEVRLFAAALERDFVAVFVELRVDFGAVEPRVVRSSGIVSQGPATFADK